MRPLQFNLNHNRALKCSGSSGPYTLLEAKEGILMAVREQVMRNNFGFKRSLLKTAGLPVLVCVLLVWGHSDASAADCDCAQQQKIGGLDGPGKEPNGLYSNSSERQSWFQPAPDKQHPYVPSPQKRYIPLAGDSTGPVVILPGGNGPQGN